MEMAYYILVIKACFRDNFKMIKFVEWDSLLIQKRKL